VSGRRDKPISQEVGSNWLAAGCPTPAPTKNCRHSKPSGEDFVEVARTHRQVQCPHCGLWALWVLR
jgi:hypothetical protein